MDKKEQTRLRVKRYRDKKNGVTPEKDVTQRCNAVEMVPASFVQGRNGVMHEFLPERPRYLTLSDGQVLDRLNQPATSKSLPGMEAANESYFTIIRQEPGILDALTDKTKRKKLERITQSLKDFNVSKEIRYGISGPTFDVAGEMLEVTK